MAKNPAHIWARYGYCEVLNDPEGGKVLSQKISNSLVGNTGEYYVCAELCKRGYLALITPKNNPLFDIVAATPDGTKTVYVQVKTRSVGNKQGWKFGKDMAKAEDNSCIFVVLVNLLEDGLPDFYVYEYDVLAATVARNYEHYLSTPKRDGEKRKDVSFRWHDENLFSEDDHLRLNNWAPIERSLT